MHGDTCRQEEGSVERVIFRAEKWRRRYFKGFLISLRLCHSALKTVLSTFLEKSDFAEDCGGGGDGRGGEVDFGIDVSHAAYEVAVRGGNAFLALCEDSHVAAEARSARRSRDYAARFCEDFQQTFVKRLQPDFLRCGDYDASDAWMDFAAAQDFCGDAQVGYSSVCA